jgi:hypothetical protein
VIISQGTNRLGIVNDLEPFVDGALNSGFKKGAVPEFWDGNTAGRMMASVAALSGVKQILSY